MTQMIYKSKFKKHNSHQLRIQTKSQIQMKIHLAFLNPIRDKAYRDSYSFRNSSQIGNYLLRRAQALLIVVVKVNSLNPTLKKRKRYQSQRPTILNIIMIQAIQQLFRIFLKLSLNHQRVLYNLKHLQTNNVDGRTNNSDILRNLSVTLFQTQTICLCLLVYEKEDIISFISL